ncbi:SEL1-like repeat protein [Psychrobacter sp. CAL346-MNA-CIBAN-0220]
MAQSGLGLMYYNGEGVRQDYAKAREWFGKSCDNGSQDGFDSYRILN